MSTITKEWLKQKIADMEEHRDLFQGDLDDDHANVLSAFRIALASLEADPVAWMWEIYGGGHMYAKIKPSSLDAKPLYTAPPAPVSVPDAMDDQGGVCCEVSYADGWNACRAAMLQNGNSPAQSDCCPAQNCIAPALGGNSPVIADGWVACSERMPEETGDIIVVSDGIVMSGISYSRKKGFYLQALEYDDDEPVDDVTHWMPLPAAPQQ